MFSFSRISWLALALLVLPASLSAAVVLPYSVVASHDNLVQSSATSETQVQNASSATVITKLFSDTNARNAYFKFSLGDAMVGNHQSATFNIWSSGANSYTVSSVTNYASWQFDLYALNTGATGYNWAENSLSKASAPAYVDRALPDSSLATFVGSFTQAAVSAAGQSYEVNFHQLERFVQSDNTVTFILITARNPT